MAITKTDHSLWCDMNDENLRNDCMHCLYFHFPIGCMIDELDQTLGTCPVCGEKFWLGDKVISLKLTACDIEDDRNIHLECYKIISEYCDWYSLDINDPDDYDVGDIFQWWIDHKCWQCINDTGTCQLDKGNWCSHYKGGAKPNSKIQKGEEILSKIGEY